MLRALLYAYVLGGVTFIPLLFFFAVFITVYTSVPVGDALNHVSKQTKAGLEANSRLDDKEPEREVVVNSEATAAEAANDLPRTRKGWLTVRRTFEETASDGSYVTLVRSFLDSRSKDPKRSRPKDMWYVVLKGTVLYLYEDEEMSECEAAIELSQHQVVIYPERLLDAELFAKRNAICLSPKLSDFGPMPSLSRKMRLQPEIEQHTPSTESLKEDLGENEMEGNAAKEQALDPLTPWFIFVRSNVDMEDWYFALIHGSEHPAQTPTLSPLHDIFDPLDMNHLVSTLDEQPDVIPMRWLNALLGRIFFSHYRTKALESYIIGRLMKKLSKVKTPAFLTEVKVTNVSVGKRAPMFSKPMLKELTKEGDASIEVHLQYRGEIRITVEATAVINLGARFKSYTVKLVLAAVLKELEGNLLIRAKRPPSNRIWYAFTQTPRMVMEVEPIVSDRQITWGMILSTIESRVKEIIQESVVMPNMDDISFFDTEPYERRGGIWSDAGRRPAAPSSAAFTSQEECPHPPVSMDTMTTSCESTQKGDDPSIHSAPAAMSAPLQVSTNLDESLDSSRNSTRRRTWFSSTTNEEMDTPSTPDLVSGSYSDKPEDGNQESDIPSSHAAFSSHQRKANLATDYFTETTSERELPLTTTRSTSPRRSVSQYSIEVPQNIVGQEVHKPIPIPRKNSATSVPVPSPSPPSFFNTLKARAADKQAIKETAKETIRKWGVNWGGFRKDTNAVGLGPSDDNSEANTDRSGFPQAVGDGNTPTQKSRTSYAEVRAAVAERKGREKASQLLDHGSEPSSLSPETTRLQTQGTLLSPDGPSTTFETFGTDASAPLPSPSRIAKRKSSSSVSRMTTVQDQGFSEEPIQVQPVAKTMSIPGIHASHRREVQSMGYVAPQPPPIASSGPMSETVLKNPAIQTVYRFLKSNGDRKQDSSELLAHNPSHQFNNSLGTSSLASPTGFLDDQITRSEVLVVPAVTSQSTLKPMPPPLPPRSISTAQHEMSLPPSGLNSLNNTVEREGSHSVGFAPQEPVSDDTPCRSPHIARRPSIDHSELSRTDLEKSGTTPTASATATGNGTPPPLPPRRPPVLHVTNDQ